MPSRKRKKGDEGEEVAFLYLKKNGYAILQRNYANHFGEIDIIAKKARTIVFVEVKSQEKTEDPDLFPERNLTWQKQQKLIRTAESFLIKNKYPDDTDWQIDVIGVILDQKNRKADLRHLQNAVQI